MSSILKDVYNDKDSKFKVVKFVIVSIYKHSFAEGYTTKWSKNIFWLKMLKLLYHEHKIGNGE